MLSNYNIAICREDKMLICNLNDRRFGKNTWQAYCLTAWQSPEIREVCAKKAVSKNGFQMIACAMAVASLDHGCIMVGGNPMMTSTLFLIEPQRLSVVLESINTSLGYGWSGNLEGLSDQEIQDTTASITIICEPYVSEVYFKHLSAGRVMGIEEAANRVRTSLPAPKSCSWIVAVVIVLIVLFFSCR